MAITKPHRRFVMPIRHLLILVRNIQQPALGEIIANDLHPHG